MPRRINVRLLLIVLGATAVVALGLFGLYSLQVWRSAKALLGQAAAAQQSGDSAREAEYLRQYLTLRPDDGAVLCRYGFLLDQRATSGAARFEAFLILEQAFRRLPERSEVGRRVVQLAEEFGHYDEARRTLILLLSKSPRDGELEEWRGRCEEATRQYADARTFYAHAIQDAPERILSYERLAWLKRTVLDEGEEADRVIEQMLALNPRSAQAYLARGRYRLKFGSATQGAADIARALTLAPDDADTVLAAADLANGQNRSQETRKLLAGGIDVHPRDARLYTALARAEQQAGHRDVAIRALRRGLNLVPDSDQNSLYFALADLLIERDELKEAQAIIARLRRGLTDPALLDYQSARILMQQKQWSGALALIERVLPGLARRPDLAAQAHLCRALCYDKLGASDLQLDALRDAVAADPSSTAARLQLGSLLLALNQVDEAIHELERIADVSHSNRLLLAQAVLKQILRVPAELRDWQRLQRLLEAVEKAAPGSMELLLLRAQFLAFQGKAPLGRQMLEKARDQQPNQVGWWLALAAWDERFGNGKATLADLDEGERRLGARTELRMVRLEYWLQRDAEQARLLTQELEKRLDELPTEEQSRLLAALAEAYAQLGEIPKAERLWTGLTERQPTNLNAWLRLFDLALRVGSDDEAGRCLERMRKIEGENGTFWRYSQAARLVLQAQRGNRPALEDARGWLKQVAGRRPQWPRVPLLEAAIAELEGDSEQALNSYQRAFDLGDHRAHVAQRLVELLYEHQQFARADDVVDQVRQEAGLPSDLAGLAIQSALSGPEPERALTLARQIVHEDAADYRHHLWLGLSLWAAGQRDEAEASLRQAVQHAPHQATPHVALIRFLFQGGQAQKADVALQDAQAQLASDKPSLGLAQCYQAAGHLDQAESQWESVLEAQPNGIAILHAIASSYMEVGRLDKALPVLRRLVDHISAPYAEKAWARRQWALALAKTGSYPRFQEALTLIEKNLQDSPRNPDDLRAEATILATQPSRQRDAIALLEGLPPGQLGSDDAFLLAQLYEAKQQWNKAVDQFQLAIISGKSNPFYLAQFVRSLLRHGEVQEAEHYLRRLERLQPQAFGTTELKARMLRAGGKVDEAVTLIERWVASQPPDQAAPAASLLEELGQIAAADRIYQKYVAQSKQPESVLLYATFLGRQQRLTEALDLCERAWVTCSPELVANVSVAQVASTEIKEDHRQRVASKLEAAVNEHPASTPLLLSLAELRNVQGRYTDAEFLYRQVLAKEVTNVLALNNLAWLLAKQGRPAEALTLVNKAFEGAGPLAQLLDTRAIIYLAMNQLDDALVDLHNALDQAPSALMYFHLAQVQWAAHERGTAFEALRKAQAAGLQSAELHPLERREYDRLLGELPLE